MGLLWCSRANWNLEKLAPVASSFPLLGDGETFSPGAWVSVQAGSGGGLFTNLSPIRNVLVNRQFFL